MPSLQSRSRGFFRQVSGLFFGKVRSTGAFQTPLKPTKAPGGTVWQLLYRLLLDSRVVDVPMAYNPAFVMLSSLKPLFFNSLKNDLCFSDNARA